MISFFDTNSEMLSPNSSTNALAGGGGWFDDDASWLVVFRSASGVTLLLEFVDLDLFLNLGNFHPYFFEYFFSLPSPLPLGP